MHESELSNITNPLNLSHVDTIETRCCFWAWNCLCYSTFCTTTMSKDAKITWNTPSPECMDTDDKEGCAAIWAWACERTNTVCAVHRGRKWTLILVQFPCIIGYFAVASQGSCGWQEASRWQCQPHEGHLEICACSNFQSSAFSCRERMRELTFSWGPRMALPWPRGS